MRPHYLLLTAVLATASARTAWAETPAAICARIGTDDTLRPIPATMVPAVNTLFDMRMPTEMAVATTQFRCASGQVMVCTMGANLPCGKADASRAPGPGAMQWCRDNPNSPFVPAYMVGHDTIYEWRCHSGVAEVARQIGTVDARGFITQYWRQMK